MEEKLTEYADKIIELVEAGVSFTGEQAPILIQEILTYYTVYHSIWAFGSFIFTSILWYIVYRIFTSDETVTDDEDAFLTVGIFTIFSLPSLVLTAVNVMNVIKINVAPRLYLLEKISSLF